MWDDSTVKYAPLIYSSYEFSNTNSLYNHGKCYLGVYTWIREWPQFKQDKSPSTRFTHVL